MKIPVGERIAGRYVVLGQIGAGGMGVVARARDERLGREVAIKILAPALGDETSARLRLVREARAAAALSHPGIVQVYDVDETPDGGIYLVMELVAGRSLRESLKSPVPRSEAVRIVSEVAHALAAAHRAGLVHRDVKPDNVMIRDDGRIAVLDFGLAKDAAGATISPVAQTALTGEGAILGTPAYIAPEQAHARDVGPAADQFALAVLAFEILTGRLPWKSTTAAAVIVEILTAEPLRASAVAPGLPGEVDDVLARGMAREAADRFEGVEEFAAALRAVLGEEIGLAHTAVLDSGRISGSKLSSARSTPGTVAAPSSIAQPTPQPVPPARSRRAVAFAVAAAAVVAVVVGVSRFGGGRASTGASPRASAEPDVPPRVDRRRITANATQNTLHRVAATSDGRIVYQDDEGIWIRRVADTEPAALRLPDSLGPVELADVAADGSRVFLVANAHRLVSIALDGAGPVRDVATVADARSVTVAPDGSAISWTDPVGVHVQEISDGRERLVAPSGGYGFQSNVEWSPDGRYLAVSRWSADVAAGGDVISTVGRDGAWMETIIRSNLLNVWGTRLVGFRAEDRLLYMMSEASRVGGRAELWEQTLADGKPTDARPRRVYTFETGIPERLVRVPDGLVALESEQQDDVYVAQLDAGRVGTPERLTLDERPDRPFRWSPAHGILFASSRRGQWDVFAQRPGERSARLVAGRPAWETYPVALGNESVLYWEMAVDVEGKVDSSRVVRKDDGSAPRVLTEMPTARQVRMSGRPPPEGAALDCAANRCVLAHTDQGRIQIEALDPDDGARRPLRVLPATERGFDLALSPDGRTIAIATGTGIRLVPTDAGPVRSFDLPEVGFVQCVAWKPAGDALYATVLGSNGAELLEVSLEGEPRTVLAIPNTWIANPTPSPDGESLALLVRYLDNDLWLLGGL